MKRNILAKCMRENKIFRQKIIVCRKLYSRKTKHKDW
jgi:hypothetical protein